MPVPTPNPAQATCRRSISGELAHQPFREMLNENDPGGGRLTRWELLRRCSPKTLSEPVPWTKFPSLTPEPIPSPAPIPAAYTLGLAAAAEPDVRFSLTRRGDEVFARGLDPRANPWFEFDNGIVPGLESKRRRVIELGRLLNSAARELLAAFRPGETPVFIVGRATYTSLRFDGGADVMPGVGRAAVGAGETDYLHPEAGFAGFPPGSVPGGADPDLFPRAFDRFARLTWSFLSERHPRGERFVELCSEDGISEASRTELLSRAEARASALGGAPCGFCPAGFVRRARAGGPPPPRPPPPNLPQLNE